MSSLASSNNNVGTVISGRRNKNKPSLPKCSSRSQPSRHRKVFKTLSITLAASSAVLHYKPSFIDGNGGGSGGSGAGGGGNGNGNGGGGGGGRWWFGRGDGTEGGFLSRFFTPAEANADENSSEEFDSHGLLANITIPLSKLSPFKKYKISEITFFDRKNKTKMSSDDALDKMLKISPGKVYTKAQIQKELDVLMSSGMFEKVEFEGKTNADGTVGITVNFSESTWQSAETFRCINVGRMPQTKPIQLDPDMSDKEQLQHFLSQEREYKRRIENARPCILPDSVQVKIMDMLKNQKTLSARLLQKIRDRVQKWYHDEGYGCAQVINFGNLNTKDVVCEVVEGDISKLSVQFLDKLGNVVEGNTQVQLIHRVLPKQLQPGNTFNTEAGKQALKNINSLALFSNLELNPLPDESSEGSIILELKMTEMEQKTSAVSTEWSIVPGNGGLPTLASIQPGGTISVEHRNLQGLNRAFSGSISTSNYFHPQDDLAFKLEYTHPYWDGVDNPRDRTLRVSCFNNQKVSPVFTGGPGIDDVPPILVDRGGVKANITENFTEQSKFTYGLVMEAITTRDQTGTICANGQRILPNGEINAYGPPTTLSGTGTDRMAFLQTNIIRDNTRFVNGTVVGERNMIQVDQGLGIGTKFPFFNRHLLTLTRFIQLMSVEEGAGKAPPPVLVLHGRYGGCIGDLPSYEAFTLGGPYSVRGYNMGEIGACRKMVELAAELRIPIKGMHVYGFAEHGNDLGSSRDVIGNPTEYYGRVGQGSSYGVGAKIGSVRAEYAVDHNSGTGALFFRFGERF